MTFGGAILCVAPFLLGIPLAIGILAWEVHRSRAELRLLREVTIDLADVIVDLAGGGSDDDPEGVEPERHESNVVAFGRKAS